MCTNELLSYPLHRFFIKPFFVVLLSVIVHFSLFSQCPTNGTESGEASINTLECSYNSVSATEGVGTGSERTYTGFTEGTEMDIYLNPTDAPIGCAQYQWRDALNNPVAGGNWETISTDPINPSVIVVPAGADRIHLTTSANPPGAWSPNSALLNYRQPNPGQPTVTVPSGLCSGGEITASNVDGAVIYFQGTNPTGTDLSDQSTSANVSDNGVYYFRALGPNGCWGLSGAGEVSLNGLASVDAGGSTVLCAGQSVQLNGSINYPNSVLPMPGGYCASSSNNTGDTRIDNVTFNTINNNTSIGNECHSYRDFTSLNTNVVRGSTHNLSVSLGTCGGGFSKIAFAWIDWNRNGEFDGGELVMNGLGGVTGNHSVTIPVEVPFGASLGATRLRVIVTEATSASPCGGYAWGETQDYQVTILPEVDFSWSGTPILSGETTLQPIVNPTTTTVYTLTAVSQGCEISSDVEVSVEPFELISNIPQPFCVGDEAELNISCEPPWTGIPTGGDITTIGNERIHTFTENGTFETTQPIPGARLLVVGGGGGGGGPDNTGTNRCSGGGGGGGYQEVLLTINDAAHPIVVGPGGAGGGSAQPGTNGGNSSAIGIESIGGGAGGTTSFAAGDQNGAFGGSGGGAGQNGAGGLGVLGQGNNGGVSNDTESGGGGGGAGGEGLSATAGGVGGPGLASDISGVLTYYAGGGGGSRQSGGVIAGGIGGGGHSGAAQNAQDGFPNTGGGGGGAARRGGTQYQSGSGGSGIVIIRYAVPNWVSSDPSVATINPITGELTAVSVGTTEITYTSPTGQILTQEVEVGVPAEINLTSAVATTNQSVCVNESIDNITYTTVGATGATVSGLPNGVVGVWNNNELIISGAPTQSGSFDFQISLTGGCGIGLVGGTIEVTQESSISLTSPSSTEDQEVCIDENIAEITYEATNATGVNSSGLPNGVNAIFDEGIITISGTPEETGEFSYTLDLIGACGNASASGSIEILPVMDVSLTSNAATISQTVCINEEITNIVYVTDGATGATVSGLPNGVTGVWNDDELIISGTPTESGEFDYEINLTGGCGTVTENGTINVNPTNTITLVSDAITSEQTVCISSAIEEVVYETTGATGVEASGLPNGVVMNFDNNTVNLNGSPIESGVFEFTITTTGGCGTASLSGSIEVLPENTISLDSDTETEIQEVCINVAIEDIVYLTTTATNANVTGLPSGVDGVWNNNVFTISGVPTEAGTFNYIVAPTGGCGLVSVSGTITVNPESEINLLSGLGTDDQELCAFNDIIDIVYGTTFASNANITGLPNGVSAQWDNGTIIISGSPTESGTFIYTVSLVEACGNTTIDGQIEVLETPGLEVINNGPVCLGDNVLLSEIGGEATSWNWSLVSGNGTLVSTNTASVVVQTPTNGDVFSVTINNSQGCQSTGTTQIEVLDLPNPVVINNSPICFGDTIQLDEISGEGVEWIWSTPNNGIISNENIQNPEAYNAEDDDVFSVMVIDANGCRNTGFTQVEVFYAPEITPIDANQTHCDSFTLPEIEGDLLNNPSYFSEPAGNGTAYPEGTTFDYEDFTEYPVTLFIYDESATSPSCPSEFIFNLTLNPTPVFEEVEDEEVCVTFEFPAIEGTNLYGASYFTEPNGQGQSFEAGNTVTLNDFTDFPVTIYIFDESNTNPNCSAEISFELTIHDLPGAQIISSGGAYCDYETPNDILVSLTGDPLFTLTYSVNGVQNTINSASSSVNLGNEAGEYVIQLIEDANCSDDLNQSVTILVKESPDAPEVTLAEPYCSKTDFVPMIGQGVADSLLWFTDEELQNLFGEGNEVLPEDIIGVSNYYVIEIVNGCESEVTIVEVDVEVCDINVTEGMSPNGDGINDVFIIENLEAFPNTKLHVYNRWGSEVYFSPDYKNDWDGRSQSKYNVGGDVLPEGTYYYIIELGTSEATSNQSGKIIKGWFYLRQ